MWCLGCRYDLCTLEEPRCPECGRGFDPADPRTFARTPWREAPRWTLAVGIVAGWWPLVAFALLHATRLAAWASLGHAPRVSLDDPKYINGMVSLLNYATGFAWVLVLPASVFAIGFGLVSCVRGRWRNAAIVLVSVFVACGASSVLVVFDPYRTVEWFRD